MDQNNCIYSIPRRNIVVDINNYNLNVNEIG